MEGSVTEIPKKDLVIKDGTAWDPEACGLIYRGGDCCFSTCSYTSDHYHCQVCGISTTDVSQALAHLRASPSCRKDPIVHYSASSVSMGADPTNSLYNALYNGFSTQNTYPTPGFSGYSQIDSYQWHPSMPDKVAICSSQLSPCCSSNGGTYIPVESQLCSPISDLYSKVTAPIRDLVSLPAKSAGSTIDPQAWFAAYNPQQMQKNAFKYSDQNAPQINFILVDPADQKHQENGEPSNSGPSSFCSKGDLGGKDILKDTYCSFASQPLPAMLSEDTLFSLQLQDETLKQAEIQQTSVSQMLLSDVTLPGKNAGQVDSVPSTSREESHFTQEHFSHYMSSCGGYHSQEPGNNEVAETSSQQLSAESDSDESDIIVEDTGDDLGSHMTESEIFIEDIKCSLLQGVVDEEENPVTASADVYRNKGRESLEHVSKDTKDSGSAKELKMQPERHIKSCLSSYHPLLKCVICEKSVSDSHPGSVFVEMNNQMPLTTSSQTPVLTKLNEVVAVEVTDFLDVNGKFMCQTCFNLVDTVDSLESKLESLKQDIATMIKNGSKPHSCAKLPVTLIDQSQSTIIGVSSDAKNQSSDSICVEELFQNSLVENPGPGSSKPVIVQDQNTCQSMASVVEGKEYMLLSGRAQFLANSINKVSLSLGQHLPAIPAHKGGLDVHTLVHQEESQNISRVLGISSEACQISAIQSVSEKEERHSGKEYLLTRNQKDSRKSPKRSKIEDKPIKSDQNTCSYKGNSTTERVSNREIITMPSNICSEVQQGNKQMSHSLDCSMQRSCEILECSQQIPKNFIERNNIELQVQLTCDLCGELFSSNDLLEVHLSRYSKSDPALCELCGQLYHNCTQLDDHMFHAHSVYRKHCESCGMKFFHPCMYKAHLETPCDMTHENVSSHSCDKCSHNLTEQTCHEDQNNALHLPKKILSKCDECDRTFTKPSDLQAHKRSHSDHKNFQCKVCGRRYKSLGNLNHHAKSHDKKKPYTCQICSQGFIRKDFYETHINSHKDSKPFKCDKCQKGFLSKAYLQTHLNWHMDKIKKVTCPICKKTFSQRLNVHMRSHTGERPHPCPKCPKKFITGSAMRKHMKRVHAQEILHGSERTPSEESDPSISDSDDPDSPYSHTE